MLPSLHELLRFSRLGVDQEPKPPTQGSMVASSISMIGISSFTKHIASDAFVRGWGAQATQWNGCVEGNSLSGRAPASLRSAGRTNASVPTRTSSFLATWSGSRAAAADSGFDGRFIDQHDRNIVFYRVDSVALGALQGFRILAVFERLLARRTDQDFQKFFGNHDLGIVRHGSQRRPSVAV